MKILFVNEYGPPHYVSGAEYSMVELAEGLRSAGHKIVILSPETTRTVLVGKPTRTVLNVKFPFPKKIKPGQVLSPLWFNNQFFWLYSAYWIYQTVKKQSIDLLHVHGKYILPGAVIAGWLVGKPVVATVRDFKFLCPLALCFIKRPVCSLKYFIEKEVSEYQKRYGGGSKLSLILAKLWQYKLKWFLNRCQQVIAVSPQLAEIYKASGVNRVDWIYNLPPLRQAQGYSHNKNTILSIGKLSYGKGTDTIIQVAKLLPQYQFIFAGELNPSLKSVFPKNCRYLGKISHEEALKLYRQAGVFVINSRWPEPLSRAGLEALSFGLPIVASNRGGNRELVKDNGFLVDPDHPQEIAAAIMTALKQKQKLGENSLQLLNSRFNRHKIIAEHVSLYRQLI